MTPKRTIAMHFLMAIAVMVALVVVSPEANAITKDEIITLSKLGFTPEEIIKSIEKDQTIFELSDGDILALKKADAHAQVLTFMLDAADPFGDDGSDDGISENLLSSCCSGDMEAYNQLCDGGEMDGCRHLGWMYEKSAGVRTDHARAVRLYKQACDGGDMEGCHALGSIYERGRGVKRNATRAAQFYNQSCDGGSTPGCSSLGSMYEKGAGVPRDTARADRSWIGSIYRLRLGAYFGR